MKSLTIRENWYCLYFYCVITHNWDFHRSVLEQRCGVIDYIPSFLGLPALPLGSKAEDRALGRPSRWMSEHNWRQQLKWLLHDMASVSTRLLLNQRNTTVLQHRPINLLIFWKSFTRVFFTKSIDWHREVHHILTVSDEFRWIKYVSCRDKAHCFRSL